MADTPQSGPHRDDEDVQRAEGSYQQQHAAAPDPAVTDKARTLAALARQLAAADRRKSLPERLAEACQHILGVAGAAITLENTTIDHITLWTTNEAAARLEDLQEVTGEGPSHEAFSTGQAVTARLDSTEVRWPQFTEAARRALSWDAVIQALPMHPDGDVLGVLTVHQLSTEPRQPSGEPSQFLADAVGAALLLDSPEPGHDTEAGPWSSRAEIHQATGIVIAQLHFSAADALAMLRAHAYAHDTTLYDIATQVITGRLDLGSDSQ